MLYVVLAVVAAVFFWASSRLQERSQSAYQALGVCIAWVVAGITFLISYGVCVFDYGFLLGVGLGWLPSGILAVIVWYLTRYLWPAMALGGMLIAVVLINNWSA